MDTTTDWSTIPSEELYQKKITSVFKYMPDDEIDTVSSIVSPTTTTSTTSTGVTTTAKASSNGKVSKVRSSPDQVRRQVSISLTF